VHPDKARDMRPDGNVRGIVAMCAAMAAFIVSDAGVKLASQTLPVGQVVLLRGLMCSALVVALLLVSGRGGDFRALRHPLVALRCGLEGLCAITFVGALSLLPLATVIATFLSAPLMITAAGALLFGETVRWRRWTAVIVGFLGMLIVVRPTAEGLNAGIALVLASTVLAVARDLVTRRIPASVPTGAVTAGAVMGSAAAGGVLALGQPWLPVEWSVLAPLAIAALGVSAGSFAIIVAFRSGEVSAVSPFRYTLMVWSVIAGYAVFGEWPDARTWAGISLIVGAGLYTLWRETRVAAPKDARA
jgi:drug/metabolite transporter (DMT)-like permease